MLVSSHSFVFSVKQILRLLTVFSFRADTVSCECDCVLIQNAEMNLTELEEALQQLNQHLISEKEMQYIYHVSQRQYIYHVSQRQYIYHVSQRQ